MFAASQAADAHGLLASHGRAVIAIREMLCATAIERPARTALRYAFFVAERFNASLSVVHVRDFVQGGRPNLYLSSERRLAQLTNEQHALERLDALVRTVPTAGSGRATTHVVDGTLAEALIAHAGRSRSDLIVMGAELRAHPVSGEEEESLAQRLGDRALCPVMTVPHTNVSSLPRIQHILCPVERWPGATKEVLAWVVLLARRFGAIVEVLRDRAEVGSSRDEVEEALRVAGVGTTTSTCPRGSTLAEASLQRVADGRCDLIVMSATSLDATRSPVLTSIRRESVTPVVSIRSAGSKRIFAGSPSGDSSIDEGSSFEARSAASARGAQARSRASLETRRFREGGRPHWPDHARWR